MCIRDRLWTNTEINNSDAFVAAWLPGSEGGGISDMLFQRDPSFEFTGRLSFAWPAKALVSQNKETLFELGYGLTYKTTKNIDKLPEISGLENGVIASTGEFFNKGTAVAPWGLWLNSNNLMKQIGSYPTSVGGLIVSKTDHKAQEDGLRIQWTKPDFDQVRIRTASTSDMSQQAKEGMVLTFSAKSFKDKNAVVKIGMCNETSSCDKTIEVNVVSNDWQEYSISLSCFAKLGVDMTKIKTAVMITGGEGVDIGISNIRLTANKADTAGCE